MANSSNRKGFSPILAFILGIFFGIVLIIGGVVAAVLVVINMKIDSFGFNKNGDEYLYINGNPDDGGFEKLKDIISFAADAASNSGNLTVGELEHKFPIAKGITSGLFETISEYVDFDEAEFKATKFSALGEYVKDIILDVKISTLLSKFGADDGIGKNKIFDLLLHGNEAEYVTYNGANYPVYYDEFKKFGNGYSHQGGVTGPLKESWYPYFEKYEVQGESGENEEWAKLYFISEESVTNDESGENKENENGEKSARGITRKFYLAFKGEQGYELVQPLTEYTSRAEDSFETALCTGNYYYASDDTAKANRIEIKPLTVRSVISGEITDNLDNVMVDELFDTEDGKNQIVSDIFHNVSLGALVKGEVDFQDIMDNTSVASLLGDVEADNKIMLYLFYNVTDVYTDGDKTYATLSTENGDIKCEVVTKDSDGKKIVDKVIYTEGTEEKEVAGATIEELTDRVGKVSDELALSDVMDIPIPTEDDSNAILIFLAYSVTDVKKEGPGVYSGIYHAPDAPQDAEGVPCKMEAVGSSFVKVTYQSGDDELSVKKTKINGISDQLNRLTQTLTLKEVININPEEKFMVKLGDLKLDHMGDATDVLTLDDFIEVELKNPKTTEGAILCYLAYGVSGVDAESRTVGEITYSHKGTYHYKAEGAPEGTATAECLLQTDGSGKVIKAVYKSGSKYLEIPGTTVSKISDKMSGITKDLTLGELIEVSAEDKLLASLKNSTIDSLPHDIENLSINELYKDSIYSPKASTTESNYVAQIYKVVDESELSPTTEYHKDYIYYLSDGSGGYKLASTTGKFESQAELEEACGSETCYTACLSSEFQILYDQSFLYFTDIHNNGVYTMVNEGRWDGSGDTVHYTYGATNAMWKLMLYSQKSGESVSKETAFSVNSLGELVTHLTQNIQKATMRELTEAGILEIDETDLNKKVLLTDKKLGDYTLHDLVRTVINGTVTTPTIP